MADKTNEKELIVVEDEVSILVKALNEGNGRDTIKLIDNLGADVLQETSRKMELMKVRVGSLLKDIDGSGGKIPQGLMELRSKLDEINPVIIGKPGWFSKLIGKTPAVGNILKKVAVKYETVQIQVDAIIDGLRTGREGLERDNIELEQIYKQLEIQQVNVKKMGDIGEMFLAKLDELVADPANEDKLSLLESVQNAAAIRTQDLRTMEQVNIQFFVSIDMTVNNNKMLSQSIARTLTVTTNLLTVGLSLQSALVNQKKAIEATKSTQQYAADLLAANAASIKQNTKEVASLYKDPVIALDKIKSAFDDLMSSMDDLENIKREGITSAKQGITELNNLSAKLEKRADILNIDGDIKANENVA